MLNVVFTFWISGPTGPKGYKGDKGPIGTNGYPGDKGKKL